MRTVRSCTSAATCWSKTHVPSDVTLATPPKFFVYSSLGISGDQSRFFLSRELKIQFSISVFFNFYSLIIPYLFLIKNYCHSSGCKVWSFAVAKPRLMPWERLSSKPRKNSPAIFVISWSWLFFFVCLRASSQSTAWPLFSVPFFPSIVLIMERAKNLERSEVSEEGDSVNARLQNLSMEANNASLPVEEDEENGIEIEDELIMSFSIGTDDDILQKEYDMLSSSSMNDLAEEQDADNGKGNSRGQSSNQSNIALHKCFACCYTCGFFIFFVIFRKVFSLNSFWFIWDWLLILFWCNVILKGTRKFAHVMRAVKYVNNSLDQVLLCLDFFSILLPPVWNFMT